MTSNLSAAAILIFGALGAIAAIFLKEAVQAALQRRVIAWQLFGYLMSWRSQISKNGQFVSIYEKVKERNHALTRAAASSTEEFRKVHLEQYEQRATLREEVKTALTEAAGKAGFQSTNEGLNQLIFSEAAAYAGEQRRLLADSKSFVSDRDAAMLGKSASMNVVQFRTALLFLLATFEALVKVLPVDCSEKPKAIATLVDHFIVYGEDMLVAMIRLEEGVDRITRKSVVELTADILLGR